MNRSVWEKEGTLAEKFWRDGRADIPVYDMHCHMGAHNGIYFKRCEPEAMKEHGERLGIKRMVFSHHASLWGSRRCAEDHEVCCRYPDFFRMYVSVNPHYPEYIREDLARFDKWQPYAVGLKILADYHRKAVTDPCYEYALDFAEERGLPVLFHTWGRSPYDGGDEMFKLVQKYSNMKILLGHSLYGEFDAAVRCVRESAGNVYCELTAIPGMRGLIELLCEKAGSEKILFGTDMPWFDEYQAVGGVLCAQISEEDKHNILYRNAQKLLAEK